MSQSLQPLIESLNDAIIGVDHDGLIQFVSHRFTSVFGYASAAVQGKNVTFLLTRSAHNTKAGDGAATHIPKSHTVVEVRHAHQSQNSAESSLWAVVQQSSVPSLSLLLLTLTPVVLPWQYSFDYSPKAALAPKLSLNDVNFRNRRVLIRVDFNVPIDAATGKVRDDNRIRETLPTIRKVLDDGAKYVVLMSHLGRPKGKRVEKASLKPVVETLSKYLGKQVTFAPDALNAQDIIKAAQPGDVILLENVRFHPGEEDKTLAGRNKMASVLAQYGGIYVSDAFGTAHRESATMTGIPRIMGAGVAGYLIEKEVAFMNRIMTNPPSPFVAIVGGAKVSDKIALLGNIFQLANKVIIGGAMAFTFLEAMGCHLGTSKVERTVTSKARQIDLLAVARELIERARQLRVELLLPLDHACAPTFANTDSPLITPGRDIPDGYMGLDVGPKTCTAWVKALEGCKTVIWNGPVGVFEFPAFAKGTDALALAVPPPAKCLSLVGGGDTAAAIKKHKARFAHVSTGGGATLELLEGKALPGLVCLTSKVRQAKM